MKIYTLDSIKKSVNILQAIKGQEEGFIAYSKGITTIPMPGYMEHTDPEGSYHIKYGHIPGNDFWVVKVAGGPHHLPLNGFMVAINIHSGKAEYLLQDEGYLTSLRTALAGFIAAKYLSNKKVHGIGIVGTGTQAKMQLELLANFTPCKTVYVWGRSETKLAQYKEYMSPKGFNITTTQDPALLGEKCNLIVTTTASRTPILKAAHIKPGTHITAVGADSPGKIELEPELTEKSNILVVDSKNQCIDHGEIAQAYERKMIQDTDLIELGTLIENPSLGRTDGEQITIADLTGIAIQDIQIVKSIISTS